MEELKANIRNKLEELLQLPSFSFEVPLIEYEKDSLVEIAFLAISEHYKENEVDKKTDNAFCRNLRNSDDQRSNLMYKLLSRLLSEVGARAQLI